MADSYTDEQRKVDAGRFTESLANLAEIHRQYSMTLVFKSPLPCKKNNLRVTSRGGRYTAPTQYAIKGLESEAFIQWHQFRMKHETVDEPIIFVPSNARMTLRLYLSNLSQDKDGIRTTLQDVLKKSGIIRDDCVKHFNPHYNEPPAEIVASGDEHAEITLEWTR